MTSAAQAAVGEPIREGFRVESPNGKVGVVETVLFGDEPQPAALAVRSGRFGRVLRIIDAAEIERVNAAERFVAVRSSGFAVSL